MAATMKYTDDPEILEIDKEIEDAIANENGEAIFECRVNGHPRPKGAWYRNGKAITFSQRNKYTSDGTWHRLVLQKVSLTDHGTYTFVCRNSSKQISSKANLFVCPKTDSVLLNKLENVAGNGIEKQLCNVRVLKGATIELEVKFQVEAIDEASYVWYKNNDILQQNDRTIILSSNKCTSLSVLNSQMTDTGIYSVVAKTKEGILSSFADVHVSNFQEFKNCVSLPPQVVDWVHEEKKINEFEQIRLICKADITINTVVSWEKHNKLLESPNIIAEEYGYQHIGLKIVKASEKDAGYYTVNLKDEKSGRSATATCRFTVKPAPVKSPPEVYLILPLQSVVACCGAKVTFNCSFYLSEPAHYYVVWRVGLYKIERSSSRFRVVCKAGEFLLYIEKLEPEMCGEVVCELRQFLSSLKSVYINSSHARLNIVPPRVIQEEKKLDPSLTTGQLFYVRQSEEPYAENSRDSVKSLKEESSSTLFRDSLNQDGPNNESCVEYSSLNQDGPNNESCVEYNRDSLSQTVSSKKAPTVRKTSLSLSDSGSKLCSEHCRDSLRKTASYEEDSLAADSRKNMSHIDMEEKSDGDDHNYGLIIMEFLYCRLDNDGLIFVRSGVGNQDVEVNDLFFVQNHTSDVAKIEWKDSTAGLCWYNIEWGNSDGSFAEAGVSSEPCFEISEPPVESLVKIRVRLARKSDAGEHKICIAAAPETVPMSLNHKLQPMEEFKRYFMMTGVTIGKGAFASVELVEDSLGDHYAAKIVKTRTQKKRDGALREFEIMKKLQHPKLVQLIDAYVAKDSFVFVIDYLWGGELFDRIVDDGLIKEIDVVFYVKQICEALQYLHSLKIAHLDLKPENIMCLSPNSAKIKIIDFGIAKILDEGIITRGIYGTRDYVAPEVLNFDRLTHACDMWSLGVVTYVLLSGVMPFNDDNWLARSTSINLGHYNYNDSAFDDISDLAKTFVDRLLVIKPEKRLSASAALNHSWITEGPPKCSKAGHMRRTRENMKSYLANYRARWQRAGNVMIAAHRLRNLVGSARTSDDIEVDWS